MTTEITLTIAIIFIAKWIIGNIADYRRKEKMLKEINIRTTVVDVRSPNQYQHELKFGKVWAR